MGKSFLLLLLIFSLVLPAESKNIRHTQDLALAESDVSPTWLGLAERDGYPDPKKAADLGDVIGLNDEQQEMMIRIKSEEEAQINEISRQLSMKRQVLSSAFASKQATDNNIEPIVNEIANLQRQLILVRLRARVKARSALNSRQLDTYANMAGPLPETHTSAHVKALTDDTQAY